MATLCMDTATDFGTIAVARRGEAVASHSWHSSARHGEHLFRYVDDVLERAGIVRGDIDSVGVSVGPGKFTSLRVGLSAAKGIALGLDLPIVGVSALRVLARSPQGPESVVRVPLMNAYRGDLFVAAYDFEPRADDEVLSPTFGDPDTVFAQLHEAIAERPVILCGEGAQTHRDLAKAQLVGLLEPGSAAVAAPTPRALVAEVVHAFNTRGPDDLALLEPQYLRPSDAKLPNKPLKIPPAAGS
ncbi:MAG: tRNA (adenosine(37)-N6)-threonylcarbamoyltransferase complex dimerization subunit type 1 TsaB [Myxococcota bacterium]